MFRYERSSSARTPSPNDFERAQKLHRLMSREGAERCRIVREFAYEWADVITEGTCHCQRIVAEPVCGNLAMRPSGLAQRYEFEGLLRADIKRAKGYHLICFTGN